MGMKYNPVDLDRGMEREELEKKTKCTYSGINPNVFFIWDRSWEYKSI